MFTVRSLLLTSTTLLGAAIGAPAPVPDPVDGATLLRGALHSMRTRQYEQYVPYKIDEDYCVWKPNGDCWMNEVVDSLWEYMKYDPPKYDSYDWYKAKYAADEGVYAYDDGAMEEYAEVLVYLYEAINDHAPYGKYDYDYQDYIDKADDKYCVWWYEGKCWTNDAVKYIDGIWDKDDPYRKRSIKRQDKSKWAVYATGKGVQSWYATVVYDLLAAVDKWGPLKYEWEDDY